VVRYLRNDKDDGFTKIARFLATFHEVDQVLDFGWRQVLFHAFFKFVIQGRLAGT
jgi:hypothetical protein